MPGEAIFCFLKCLNSIFAGGLRPPGPPSRGAAPAPRRGLGGPEPRPIFQTFQFFVLSPMDLKEYYGNDIVYKFFLASQTKLLIPANYVVM